MVREVGSSNAMDPAEIAETVQSHELPESILPFLDRYDELIGDRSRMFWKWFDSLLPEITLSCVDQQYWDDVQEAKLLASILVVVIDDLAEKHDDRQTFEEAARVPVAHESVDPTRAGVNGHIVQYIQTLWQAFDETRPGPRRDEFTELLMFDLKQVINAIEYSYIVNHHLEAATESELWIHDVHNMAVHVYADLDLMCSPSFDENELNQLREVVRHAERFARICNWVTTWERELHEGDCSSGVVVHALDHGIISLEALQAIRANPTAANVTPVIQAIREADIQSYFRKRLDEELDAAKDHGREIESVDIDAYLDGFVTVRAFHNAGQDLL